MIAVTPLKKLVIITIFVSLFIFLAWKFSDKSTSKKTIIPGQVTVKGELVCLPHKNTDGPQTLECAFGLKDEKGDHYALHDPEFKYLMNLSMGTKIVVEGVLTEQTDSKYDVLGLIQIESIK